MSIASARTVPTYPDPGDSSPYEVTYDDYMEMPETNRHVEVVDGVIYVMPGPTIYHQVLHDNLFDILRSEGRRLGLGLFVSSPLDVIIRTRPKLRVRQPDILFFSDASAGVRVSNHLELIHDGRLKPDLVVEILSPGQNERTLAGKLADYASIAVEEVWFVDPEAKSIRVLVRGGASYCPSGEFRAGNRITSTILPGIDLDPAALFAG